MNKMIKIKVIEVETFPSKLRDNITNFKIKFQKRNGKIVFGYLSPLAVLTMERFAKQAGLRRNKNGLFNLSRAKNKIIEIRTKKQIYQNRTYELVVF